MTKTMRHLPPFVQECATPRRAEPCPREKFVNFFAYGLGTSGGPRESGRDAAGTSQGAGLRMTMLVASSEKVREILRLRAPGQDDGLSERDRSERARKASPRSSR